MVFGCWSYRVAVASGADRLGTIDLPYASGGVFHGRAIVPNSSTRRASVGVLRFSAVGLTGLRWLQAPIDWGQSIYHTPAAVSSMVELLSPIALPDALASVSYGFSAVGLTGSGGFRRRSIEDNRSTIRQRRLFRN